MWLVQPRLVHTAVALHAGPVSTPTCHTLYVHVSLIDAFGSTSCHRLGTVSHCAFPPWQTPRLEIGLLPPSFSRLLQIFFNKDLPSAQVIRLQILLLHSCHSHLRGLATSHSERTSRNISHRSYLYLLSPPRSTSPSFTTRTTIRL